MSGHVVKIYMYLTHLIPLEILCDRHSYCPDSKDRESV